MQKLRPLVAFVLVAAIFVGGLWLGFKAPSLLGFRGTQRVLNTSTVLQQVQTLSELVTVKYVMEKVIIFEDVKWYPGGESRVLLLAHGNVLAGVDLKKLQPEDLSVTDRTLRIKLPPPNITATFLVDGKTHVIERTTGLLRQFDKDLEQTARNIAVGDITRAAREAGILKDAESRARDQLKMLFLQAGFESVEFQD
jgi:hypothetical protein